jgi:hypothetical protein
MIRRQPTPPQSHLDVITLALDAKPYIERHMTIFERLPFSWTWHVVEGVARNVACTSWCRPIPPRLSMDGTHQYLESLRRHPNVRLHTQPLWNGKVEMCNRAARGIARDGVLMQIDADEIWTVDALCKVVEMFAADEDIRDMSFRCRYFVGPSLVVTERGSNLTGIWRRAWRSKKGIRFQKHEPPVVLGAVGRLSLTPDETAAHGLFFNHYAYATRQQVAFKETYYSYSGAVEQWDRLQAHNKFPARLRDFLPWAGEESYVVKWNGR